MQVHREQPQLEEEDGLEEKKRLERPRLYQVLLLNDDFTPMDFVVEVLEQFFFMSRQQAIEVMLKVHHEGVGLCGVFTREVAETKVREVIQCSQQHQHPLVCVMEEE